MDRFSILEIFLSPSARVKYVCFWFMFLTEIYTIIFNIDDFSLVFIQVIKGWDEGLRGMRQAMNFYLKLSSCNISIGHADNIVMQPTFMAHLSCVVGCSSRMFGAGWRAQAGDPPRAGLRRSRHAGRADPPRRHSLFRRQAAPRLGRVAPVDNRRFQWESTADHSEVQETGFRHQALFLAG